MAMVMRSAPMAAGALGIGAVLYGGAKYGDAALPYYNGEVINLGAHESQHTRLEKTTMPANHTALLLQNK